MLFFESYVPRFVFPGINLPPARWWNMACAGIVLFLPISGSGQTWILNAAGNWNANSNWSSPAFPDAVGASVTFGNVITANRTITLGQNITVGSITFDDNNAYTLLGSNRLTFDATAGNASISSTGANHVLGGTTGTTHLLNDTVAVSVATGRTLTWRGPISGAGGLIFDGPGTLTIVSGAANTFTGNTFINNGRLNYSKSGALGGGTTVTIGDGIGAAESATLVLASGSISGSNIFTPMLLSDGYLDINSGSVVRLTSLAGSGRVDVTGNNSRELTGGAGDTTYAGTITGGAAGGTINTGNRFIKSGSGVQTLSGNNTFVSNLFIGTGSALEVTSNNGLGSTAVNSFTETRDGGQLRVSGGITSGELLRLTGTGVSSSGALLNISGNNTFSTQVNLLGATRIQSDAGTLSLAGGITGTNTNLTVAGDGQTTVSGAITTGTGGLTKLGSGTLSLNGVNTYTGATTINAGRLLVGGGAERIADASDLTIAAGATFEMTGGMGTETIGALAGAGSIQLNFGNTFVTNTASDTVFSGGILGGYNTFRKAGSGDLTLTGSTSTYTGLTFIDGGTLIAASNTSLGASTFGNEIATGATLALQGNITLTEGSFSLQGTGDGGTGALRNISGNNTLTAQLNFGGATTLTSDAGSLTLGTLSVGSDLTFTGAGGFVIDGQMFGSGGLTKSGTGTLTLAGGTAGNSYSGATHLNDGTLLLNKTAGTNAIGNSTALTIGDGVGAAGSAIVRLAARDQIANATPTIAIASDGRFDLNGFNEAFNTLSGSGQITLGSGTLDLGVNSGSSTYDGVISGSGNFTKSGSGTVTLTADNTFTGTTTVSTGTLRIGTGGTTGSLAGNLTNNGVVIFDRANASAYAGILAGTGTVEKAGTGNLTLSGNNTYSGATTVSHGTLTLAANTALGTTAAATTVNSSATLALTNNISAGEALTNNGTVTNTTGTNTLSGIISGSGNLTTTAGHLTLANTNTYSGNTTVGSGSTLTLAAPNALGSGTTTVNAGGTLALTSGITAAQTSYTLAGTGNATAGAIQNLSSDNRLTGDFTLTGNTTFQSDAGILRIGSFVDIAAGDISTETFATGTHALTIAGSGNTVLGAELTGSGNLIKDGSGTFTMENGRNLNWTGQTLINDGTMIAGNLYNDAPNVGPLVDFTFNNSVTVGDGSGAANSAILTLGTNDVGAGNDYANLFAANIDLTVNADGTLNTRGHNQYLRDINLHGGTINARKSDNISSDALFITGDISSTNTSTINGLIDFDGDMTKTISTAAGSTLDINARLQNGGIDKTGTGTLILSGNNTYTGVTTVAQGIVRVDNNSGLGAVAGATVVNAGAQLQLAGVTIANEALTLNGSGISSDGALQVFSGTNSWSGTVTLATNSTINAAAGANLTLSGILTGSGRTLTVNGAGNTTFTGSNTYSTLNQQGPGTLTLSGAAKTITTTNVSAGTLTLGSSNILADSMDLNVSGGTFAMGSGIAETIDQLNISGTGNLNIDGILTMNGGTISGGDGSGSTGTLTLTAGNTLNITNDFDFGGTLDLTAGTTLALAGGSTLKLGVLNVTGDTVIDFGAIDANTLNLNSLVIAPGVTITVNNWFSFQDLWTTGSFTGGFGTVILDQRDNNTAQITFTGFSATSTIWRTFDAGPNEITVPEPSSYGAILIGFGLAVWTLRRPRRNRNE